jgi:hypothetical protein
MAAVRISLGKVSAVFVAALLAQAVVMAGEISGIPPSLPPGVERDFVINFSNDFLGRGGSVDDFRTQQIIVSADINEQWLALVDHSLLTLSNTPAAARIDQMAASVGYRLMDKDGIQVTVGGGVRSIDDFAGDRMQNGFHRLIGSKIEDLQYTGSSTMDLTTWADLQLYRDIAMLGSWTAGYSLGAATLVSSAGEWDNRLSALATMQRDSISLWLGLQGDWRTGYDADPVLAATAGAEQDAALVIGMRFGALLLETVQQFGNDASYGQIMLVSSGARRSTVPYSRGKWAIDFSFVLPDVEVQLTGKTRREFFARKNPAWREFLFVRAQYGQPQYQSMSDVYIDTVQLETGLEWERSLLQNTNWLDWYAGAGLAWRSEELNHAAAAVSVNRAAATLSMGLRFFATTLGQRWNYRLQLGLSAVLPFGENTVQAGADRFTLQQHRLGFALGMSFDFR